MIRRDVVEGVMPKRRKDSAICWGRRGLLAFLLIPLFFLSFFSSSFSGGGGGGWWFWKYVWVGKRKKEEGENRGTGFLFLYVCVWRCVTSERVSVR